MAPAVDADGFASDEVTVDQRQHGLRNLEFAAPATKRRGTFDCGNLSLGCPDRWSDRTGSHRVDEDVVRRQLERQRFGERNDRALRDVVRKELAIAWAAAPG